MQTIPLDIRGGATVPLAVSNDGGATIPLGIEGAEGTNDYNRLINKPSINAVELIGNKSFPQLGIDVISEQDIDRIIYGG